MNAGELGVEMAKLVRGEPRLNSKTLEELIDEVNVVYWQSGSSYGFDDFLNGFIPPNTPGAEAAARIDGLASSLDLNHSGNRHFNLKLARESQKGAYNPNMRRYLIQLSKRLAVGRGFSSRGLLPLIDAIITDTTISIHRVNAQFPTQVEEAHERLMGYLARQAKGNAQTVLAAEELRTKLANCDNYLVSELVAKDYP